MSAAIGLCLHLGVVTSHFIASLKTVQPVLLSLGPIYNAKNALGRAVILLDCCDNDK